jgi:hypothetical protein
MTPPQHSITAPITVYAFRAFDADRIIAERGKMSNPDAHPFSVYWSGDSRFAIDTPGLVGDKTLSARDYLLPDHGCREWKPKRLRAVEVCRCRDAGGKVGQLSAFALACGEGRPLNDAQVEEFVDEYGLDEICWVGEAALRASEAPKAAEKKP